MFSDLSIAHATSIGLSIFSFCIVKLAVRVPRIKGPCWDPIGVLLPWQASAVCFCTKFLGNIA